MKTVGEENMQGSSQVSEPVTRSGTEGDVKKWEDTRCPICLDHPHNAVLLQCSCYDRGCRAYLCNTSCRHSNCLDKFVGGTLECPSTASFGQIGSVEGVARMDMNEGDGLGPMLACPLCRGEVQGWFVDKNGRALMDSKVRTCCVERCEFSGNYRELRKHARKDHPFTRPTDVDPERQESWMRMEHQTALSELRHALFADDDYDEAEDDDLEEEQRGRDAVSLLGIFCAAIEALSFLQMGIEVQEQSDAYNQRIGFSRGSSNRGRNTDSRARSWSDFEENENNIDFWGNPSGRTSHGMNNSMRHNSSFRRSNIRERRSRRGPSRPLLMSNNYPGVCEDQRLRRQPASDISRRWLSSSNDRQQRMSDDVQTHLSGRMSRWPSRPQPRPYHLQWRPYNGRSGRRPPTNNYP